MLNLKTLMRMMIFTIYYRKLKKREAQIIKYFLFLTIKFLKSNSEKISSRIIIALRMRDKIGRYMKKFIRENYMFRAIKNPYVMIEISTEIKKTIKQFLFLFSNPLSCLSNTYCYFSSEQFCFLYTFFILFFLEKPKPSLSQSLLSMRTSVLA